MRYVTLAITWVLALGGCKTTSQPKPAPQLRMQDFFGDAAAVYPTAVPVRIGWSTHQLLQAIPRATCAASRCTWKISHKVGEITGTVRIGAKGVDEIVLEIPLTFTQVRADVQEKWGPFELIAENVALWKLQKMRVFAEQVSRDGKARTRIRFKKSRMKIVDAQ